jgi:hypothetical protein
MRKLIVWSLAGLTLLLVMVQCKNKNEEYSTVEKNENLHEVTVKEVLNANAYTYLLVNEGDKEYWMAIPLAEVKVGNKYTYESGMEMLNFESKDLNKTFESVLFVEALIDPSAPVQKTPAEPMPTDPHGNAKKTASDVTSTTLMEGVTLAKDAISIHDLFANKDKYAGKTVIVTGKVVTFNPEIMNKNWIHVQDGSSFKGLNDITITTLAKVSVNDIVTLKGKVVLDKDFGMGYKYDVIIEDATVVK